MSRLISINSKNNISINNNTYKYKFATGSIVIDDNNTLAIEQVSVPNSVCNFTNSYGNLTFGYVVGGKSSLFSSALGGGSANITFSIAPQSGYTITLNITSGFLWIGYYVTIVGLNTSQPLIITNISINDVASSTASVTFNQYVVTTGIGATTGVAYIVGNQMIVGSSSIINLPQVNMLLTSSGFNSNGTNTLSGFLTVITSVLQQVYNAAIYLITLSNPIPYSALITQFYSGTISNYMFPVTLSQGYYQASDINSALHATMFNNGHYYYQYSTNPVTSVQASGLTNTTIYYPLSISNNYTNYSFNIVSTPSYSGSGIESQYGTGATFPSQYISNGDFTYQYVPVNTSVLMGTLANWTYSATNGTVYLNNGSTSFASPVVYPTGSNYLTLYQPTTSYPSITLTSSSVYIPSGTYSFGLNYYYTNIAIVTSITVKLINTNTSTTWSITASPVVASTNTWTGGISYAGFGLGVFTTTIPSGTYANQVQFVFSSSAGTIGSSISITQLAIIPYNQGTLPYFPSPSYPYYPVWQGGTQVSNVFSLLLPNAYQPTSSSLVNGLVTYTTTNKYSLGYYLGASLAPDMALTNGTVTNFVNGYSLPPFGLNMNPIVGFIIKCNLTSNNVSNITDAIDGIPLLNNFGSNNLYVGNPFSNIKLRKGRYSDITFTLCDQNGNEVALLDPTVVLSFLFQPNNFKQFATLSK
jgi:hypothetical protein